MTLYKQQGYRGNKLTPVSLGNKTPLEILALSIVPTIEANTNIKNYKANNMIYVISGEITPNENGEYKRNDNNLKSRDLIIIDIEDIKETLNEAIEIVKSKLANYKYLLFSTISHTENKPRLRLILEPNRPILKDEYKPTISNVMDIIGLNYDKSSATWSQLQGTRIKVKGTEAVFIKNLNGKTFEVAEAPKIKNEAEQRTNNEKIQHNEQEAIEIFKKYLEFEKNHLQERNEYFLSVIMVLAKSVILNEITYDIALECCELLAFNNTEWIDGNIKLLNDEIKRSCGNIEYFKTKYTFETKFNFKKKDIETILNSDEITSNSELYYILESIGKQWREENTTRNEKTGVEKVPLMQHYTIANKLIKLLPCKYGGYDEQTALLYFYDFDKGIYTPNEDILKKAIAKLEYRYKLDNIKAIVEGLKIKLNFERPVRNPNLIAVGNGIFNLKTKELEPFSPQHFITAKIDTNYNKDAIKNYEAVREKLFDLDNWLNEIACNDSEVVELFWQLINEAINPNKTRRKIAIMFGSGKNGKSTFQSFIVNLIGANNVSSITPHEIQQRFGVGGLEGKICNYADEIGTRPLDEVDKIKSIASGEVIAYERKNKDVRYYDFKTLLMFNSNQLPTIKEKSDAVLDRLLIIPFNADFKGKEDSSIKDSKLTNPIILEYALFRALHLDFEKFTIPKVVSDMVEEYKKDNDSLHAYLLDFIDRNLHHVLKLPVSTINEDYERFCRENGYTPLKRPIKKIEMKLNNTFKNNTYYYSVKNSKYNINDIQELKRFKLLNKYIIEIEVGEIRKSLVQEIKKE